MFLAETEAIKFYSNWLTIQRRVKSVKQINVNRNDLVGMTFKTFIFLIYQLHAQKFGYSYKNREQERKLGFCWGIFHTFFLRIWSSQIIHYIITLSVWVNNPQKPNYSLAKANPPIIQTKYGKVTGTNEQIKTPDATDLYPITQVN